MTVLNLHARIATARHTRAAESAHEREGGARASKCAHAGVQWHAPRENAAAQEETVGETQESSSQDPATLALSQEDGVRCERYLGRYGALAQLALEPPCCAIAACTVARAFALCRACSRERACAQ